MDGGFVSVVTERAAFLEDCARAAIIVTPLHAPGGCAAPIVIDRDRLAETGAITLRIGQTTVEWTTARESGEDRPWSPKPPPRRKTAAPPTLDMEAEDALDAAEPP